MQLNDIGLNILELETYNFLTSKNCLIMEFGAKRYMIKNNVW